MQWSLGKTKGQGAAIRKVLEAGQERKDQQLAERGQRIMASGVWEKDFFPMISRLHDLWLDKVKQGEAHIDSLKSLDDLVSLIDGSVQLGAGAMNRIAERRLKASEIKQKIDEAVAV
jgi:hypothetical protein